MSVREKAASDRPEGGPADRDAQAAWARHRKVADLVATIRAVRAARRERDGEPAAPRRD